MATEVSGDRSVLSDWMASHGQDQVEALLVTGEGLIGVIEQFDAQSFSITPNGESAPRLVFWSGLASLRSATEDVQPALPAESAPTPTSATASATELNQLRRRRQT